MVSQNCAYEINLLRQNRRRFAGASPKTDSIIVMAYTADKFYTIRLGFCIGGREFAVQNI